MYSILVLCTGNSCRSIMAEALFNHAGASRVQAYSAGSQPTGAVHPQSLATLERHGIASAGYHSKSWDAFTQTPLDLVITVCDNAAGETCPVFYGAPLKAHWGVPDPAHFQGTEAEIRAEFDRVFSLLQKRVEALLALPFETMDKAALTTELQRIGLL
jgi:arsenate reductase (thioredoxin)